MKVARPVGRILIALTMIVSIGALVAPASAGSSRPDASIKLCGWGDTCRHVSAQPYRGNDIYNATGARQTSSSGMEEGNDIRFWIKFQNDGSLGDTFYVQGCRGNNAFVVRAVLVGAFTQSTYAPNITRQFKRGTAHFEFDPADTSREVVITLDIWARTSTFGVGYACPVTLSSAADPSIKDTVVAKMVTCLRNCVLMARTEHGVRM